MTKTTSVLISKLNPDIIGLFSSVSDSEPDATIDIHDVRHLFNINPGDIPMFPNMGKVTTTKATLNRAGF